MTTLEGKPVHPNVQPPSQANNLPVKCNKCGKEFMLRSGHVCCTNCDDGAKLPPGWSCSVCKRRGE